MNSCNCEYQDFVFAFKKDEYEILRCQQCNHHMTNPAQVQEPVEEMFSDDYFYGGKDGYPDYTINKENLIRYGKYYAEIVRKYTKTGKMLDIGAAAGFILKGFIDAGWRGTGLDPNETMVNYGRKYLDLDLHTGSLESFNEGKNYDLVILIQVIAHLRDIDFTLGRISTLLKNDGLLLIETWNRDSITAKLFGTEWHEYSPPTTIHYFSRKTLDKFMTHHGFQKVANGKPKKYILGQHARSLLRHKLENSKFFNWLTGAENIIPRKLLLPYPSEDVFWAIYKKNEKIGNKT